MRIKEAHLINYKCYKDQKFTFSEGLNVFIGQSDGGKSAFVTSMQMVITGKTKSRNYIHRGAANCTVSVSDYTNYVKIIKGKPNQYVLNLAGTSNKLVKIDQSSISQAQEVLNLSKVNIQTQREHFFLLDQSPGNRSKTLNNIAGLGIIDSSIKGIKAVIQSQSKEFSSLQQNIYTDTQFMKQTAWAEDAHKLHSIIVDMQESIHNNKSKLLHITNTCNEIKDVQDLIVDIPASILSDIDNITTSIAGLVILVNKRDALVRKLRQRDALQQEIVPIPVIDIGTKISKIKNMYSVLGKCEKILTQQAECCRLIQDIEQELNDNHKVLHNCKEQLSSIKFCPTCKRDF